MEGLNLFLTFCRFVTVRRTELKRLLLQILHLTDDNEGFGKRHSYLESLSAIRGQQIATMESQNLDQIYDNISPIPKINIKEETHKVFAKFQQVTLFLLLFST